MTWVYLHLVTNHFPAILTLVGTVAAIVGVTRRQRGAWLYGVVTLALAGASAIPSWITGYQAHYVVEKQLGVPEGMVETHEVVAEATMWAMITMAGLAGFAWWRATEEARRGPAPPWVRPAVLAAALTGSVMIGVTAFLGARISHGPEATAAQPPASTRAQPPAPPPRPPTAAPQPRLALPRQ